MQTTLAIIGAVAVVLVGWQWWPAHWWPHEHDEELTLEPVYGADGKLLKTLYVRCKCGHAESSGIITPIVPPPPPPTHYLM